MKCALAAALLSCALAAHAQAPPEAQPAPAGTPPAAAPAPERESPQNPAAAAAPAAEGTEIAAPAAEPQPPPKPAAPRPSPPKPPPPAATGSTHDAELAALRAEVNRLQSELDAERAAALPAPEEAGGAQPARSLWEWLLVTALLALAAGFFLGWRLLDRRIRAKYGGLRIY